MSQFPPSYKNDLKNLSIDFDGVIHNSDKGFYDGTCYGEPIDGAIDSIKKLSKKFKIIIFTAKAKSDRPLINGKTGTEHVKNWLTRYGLIEYISEITSEKPRACLYIDDNALRFENWNQTIHFIDKKINI
tara:strand:+ start:500 stop:889 length:390 start_codon:yes stop_codon:yes gene_type:complete